MSGMTPGAIADAVVKVCISLLIMHLLAYYAHQLPHSFSSHMTFQKREKTTHNEMFYYGLLEVLEADQAKGKVCELLCWYNRYVLIYSYIEFTLLTPEPLANFSLDFRPPLTQLQIVPWLECVYSYG
jgi:Family of unknown function (DUF6698)